MPRQQIKTQDMDIPLPFPTQGIDLTTSFEAQRPLTCPTAVNVRGYEPISLRPRGGSRPGLAQYIPQTVNGANVSVQEINAIIPTGALASAFTTPLSGTFLTGTTPGWGIWNSGRLLYQGGIPGDTFQSVTTDGTNFYVTSLAADGQTGHLQSVSQAGVLQWAPTTTVTLTLDTVLNGKGIPGAPIDTGNSNAYQDVPGVGLYRYVTSTGALREAVFATTAQMATAMGAGTWRETGGVQSTAIVITAGSHCITAIAMVNVTPLTPTWTLGMLLISDVGGMTAVTFTDTVPNNWALWSPPIIITDGTAFYFCIPGGRVQRVTTGGTISWAATAATCLSGTSFSWWFQNNVSEIIIGNTTPPGGTQIKTSDGTTVAGGSQFGNNVGSIQDLGDDGSGMNNHNGFVAETGMFVGAMVSAVAKIGAGFNWTTGPVQQVGPIAGVTAGSSTGYNAVSDYHKTVLLLAVAGGVVKIGFAGAWYAVTNNSSGGLSSTVPVIRSAQNAGKMYFADGASQLVGGQHIGYYYQPSNNSLNDWTISAGTWPVDSANNGPRLIETWRGRTVVSGLLLDPYNWFMSRVGDPTDWDYAPVSPSATQAVAGNNAPQGLGADVITGIVPYTDDVLIFGMDHQLWMMRGDPMSGGNLDLISKEIGMAWGRAWCVDPYGNIFFASNRSGIYRLIPGQQPVRISQQIEQFLVDLSVDLVIIRLAWNDRFQGVDVWVTPIFGAALTNHFFWEMRTNAWWVDNFANNAHNPLCCLSFYGKTASDKGVLIGSWDGYVRTLTPHLTTDDGTTLSSYVWIGPLTTKELDAIMFHDITAVMGATSGSITYQVYVGASAELAFNSIPVVTGTWNPGRNYASFIRRRGHALYLRLSSTNQWALEALRAKISTKGKVSRREKGFTPAAGGTQ